MPEIMHGTEPGLMGVEYCDITWDKSLGGTRWKFITQKDMDMDSMHNNL